MEGQGSAAECVRVYRIITILGVARYLLDGYPQLFVIANRDADGNLLETSETARQWHSDHSFKRACLTSARSFIVGKCPRRWQYDVHEYV